MAVNIEETMDTLGNPLILISDPEKNKATFKVMKGNNGYAFYEIAVDKGLVPAKLKSQYTKLKDAERAVVRYLEISPKTQAVKRDENTAAREAQKKKLKQESES